MCNNNLPIGVFDSGIGGLAVLKELCNCLTSESFLYLGDNGNKPYGNKSLIEVERLSFNCIERLLDVGVKAIVIGCNTVSVNLYNTLKDKYNIPIIPTLPPIIYDDNTFIMCTDLSAKSEYVNNIYKDRIIGFKTLASEIENLIYNLDNINLKGLLSELPRECKRLVLGCTHYSFLEEKIKKEFNFEIITPYSTVIEKIINLLKKIDGFATSNRQNIEFIGDYADFNKEIFFNVLVKSG